MKSFLLIETRTQKESTGHNENGELFGFAKVILVIFNCVNKQGMRTIYRSEFERKPAKVHLVGDRSLLEMNQKLIFFLLRHAVCYANL